MIELCSELYLTVRSCNVTYVFQTECIFYSCLNVKELLAPSRSEIGGLSEFIWTRTQYHLIRKRALNH